jgi:hypothetical protein
VLFSHFTGKKEKIGVEGSTNHLGYGQCWNLLCINKLSKFPILIRLSDVTFPDTLLKEKRERKKKKRNEGSAHNFYSYSLSLFNFKP